MLTYLHSFQARVLGYMAILTDDYPPIGLERGQGHRPRSRPPAPASRAASPAGRPEPSEGDDDERRQSKYKGEGYAVANLDDLGEGPGFRKIRKELGVTAFGVNAIVLPPTYETGSHFHDEQEELYFLHRASRVHLRRRLDPAARPRRPRLGRRPDPAQGEEPERLRRGGLRGRRRQGRLRGQDGKLAEGETHR